TQATFGNDLAMSFDGKLVSALPHEILQVSTRSIWCRLPSSVSAVSFSPTEDRIAVVNDTRASPSVVGDLRPTGKQRRGPPRYNVFTMDRNSYPRIVGDGQTMAFSPDGKRIAVGAWDSQRPNWIEIYDLTTGKPAGLPAGRSFWPPDCTCLRWAPNDQRL